MNSKLICGFLLFLLFNHDQGRAKPITSVQSLSKLLEDDLEQPVGSEEMEQEHDETLLTGDVEQQDAPFQWYRSPREELHLPEGSFQRLFSDLLASSRRYRGRSKKGLTRGCFGVKLDRIGTLSGLGC